MAIISEYPIDATPQLDDKVIGTSIAGPPDNNTVNFSIRDIFSLYYDAEYVPYTGATANVDLGSYNLTVNGNLILGSTIDDEVNKLQVTGSSVFNGGPDQNALTLSSFGLSQFVGTTASESAILLDEELSTATGAGWTGVDFNNGYTHTSGTTPLVSTVTPIGTYYQISWSITDWTLGSFTIRFGSFFYTPTSSSGSYNQFVISSAIPFQIIPTSNFNGTVFAGIQQFTPSLPISTFSQYPSDSFAGADIRRVGQLCLFLGNYSGLLALDYASSNNSFFGDYAGYLFSQGSANTLFGTMSGSNLNNANSNTLIGNSNMYNLVFGENNTSLGTGTYALTDSDYNTITMGYLAQGLGSNTTVIGNSSTILAAIYGNLLLGGTSNRNAKLDVTGPSLQNGNRFFSQPIPPLKTASATLTIAELLKGIVLAASSATAVSLQLPSATLTNAGILGGLSPADTAFDWSVINTNSSAGIVTITSGTNHTTTGSTTIPIQSQAMFRTVKTALGFFITYRIS